jgi:hypothetical protein
MKTILRLILGILLALLLFGGGFAVGQWFAQTKSGHIASEATLQAQVTSMSELATAKLEYQGLVRYEQGEIDFINKKGFTMVYSGSAIAGVDLTKAKVSVEGKAIRVTLPSATVTSTSIDPDSLTFYDTSWAIFNWENKEDTAKALQLAQKDLEGKVSSSDELISQANDQARKTIEGLMEPFTSDESGYTLEISCAS